jgi:hypothetical protein
MQFRYQSGEEVKKGDRVTYMRVAMEVEFIANPDAPERETDWYIKEYGGGIMVWERNPKTYGRVFFRRTEDVDELLLVRRA